MKQKNPELILHFFVAQDSKGKPRQLEIHLIPEKEVSMANQRFTEYLRRQREMYNPSFKATCLILICVVTSFPQE